MRKQLCPGTKNRQIPTSIYKIIVIGSQAISCKTKSGNNLPCSNPTMLMYIEKVFNVFSVQLLAVIIPLLYNILTCPFKNWFGPRLPLE